MTPRLKASTKWTGLPPELCEQIREVFMENFEPAIKATGKKGDFLAEGRIYGQELLLRIGYIASGQLRQANFEVSLDFNPSKQNALEMIHYAIDCAASMVQEYFDAEEDLESFPRQWQKFTVEGKDAYLQISTVNTKLEAEADRLLGAHADDLVQGEDEVQEEEAVITMLGLDDDEDPTAGLPDDEPAGPKKKKPVKH